MSETSTSGGRDARTGGNLAHRRNVYAAEDRMLTASWYSRSLDRETHEQQRLRQYQFSSKAASEAATPPVARRCVNVNPSIDALHRRTCPATSMVSTGWYGEYLYNIQCSEIFTLRNEKLHTET